jgi:hypothetical protein
VKFPRNGGGYVNNRKVPGLPTNRELLHSWTQTRLSLPIRRNFPQADFEGRSRSTSNTRGASRSVEFLGESDEKPFRPADVAKPIRVLIPDYFAYELCAALAKPAKRLVDVVHGEHDAEVA